MKVMCLEAEYIQRLFQEQANLAFIACNSSKLKWALTLVMDFWSLKDYRTSIRLERMRASVHHLKPGETPGCLSGSLWNSFIFVSGSFDQIVNMGPDKDLLWWWASDKSIFSLEERLIQAAPFLIMEACKLCRRDTRCREDSEFAAVIVLIYAGAGECGRLPCIQHVFAWN